MWEILLGQDLTWDVFWQWSKGCFFPPIDPSLLDTQRQNVPLFCLGICPFYNIAIHNSRYLIKKELNNLKYWSIFNTKDPFPPLQLVQCFPCTSGMHNREAIKRTSWLLLLVDSCREQQTNKSISSTDFRKLFVCLNKAVTLSEPENALEFRGGGGRAAPP